MHASLIKPNLSEAYAAAKLPSHATLDEVAERIIALSQSEKLLITKSEAGMSLFERNGQRYDFPVRSKELKDVTGAGDTVLAMLSFSMGNNLDLKHSVQLSNVAAGMAIERLGCARITLSEMAHRLLEFDVVNKIFDENHLFALSQALKDTQFSVLGLDVTQGLTTSLFKSLRKLSSENEDEKLIIYITDNHPDEEFISLLSSLSEVDFIVRKSESLQHLCEAICPHKVYIMEGVLLTCVDHHSTLFDKLVSR
jgi:D-beta-D-heptose 7-phosphate kinase/D-beta-D-heptose 1-phosphate adenosyltransferase